jgi:hypothetical protein
MREPCDGIRYALANSPRSHANPAPITRLPMLYVHISTGCWVYQMIAWENYIPC